MTATRRASSTSRRPARTPFHRLVRVELRKSYDTRAGFWLLAVIGLVVLAARSSCSRW